MAMAGAPAGEPMRSELAESIAGRALPPVPDGLAPETVTLVLFYQCGAPPTIIVPPSPARTTP